MCGIYGGTASPPPGLVASLARALRHRGPDGGGWYDGVKAFIGIQRLAIIDPTSPHGPLASEDRRIHAVMNGEIYNETDLRALLICQGHIFATGTDTEVLVHAYEEWGKTFVEKLDGMFALLLLDEVRGRLYAARDRLGIKPLYWRLYQDQLVYASSARALACLPGAPATLSAEGMVEFLYRQSVAAPRSVYEGINAVEAGTIEQVELPLDSCRPQDKSYWHPKPHPVHRTESELDTRLAKTFQDAVRRHARTDRPAAIALSGGIDSGLLASMVSTSDLPAKAAFLDVGEYPGLPSERAAAERVAQRFGLSLQARPLPLSRGEAIRAWIGAAERPPADGFNTYLLCASLPPETVVLFSGLGADELFGGYPELLEWVPAPSLVETVARFFRATQLLPPQALQPLARCLDVDLDALIHRLYSDAGGTLASAGVTDGVEAVRLLLLRYYLTPCLLDDADVYSMAHGVELRVPFLDQALVELALSIPARMLFAGGLRGGKRLLRRLAVSQGLPDEVTEAPKQGFALPYQTLQVPGRTGLLTPLVSLAPGHPATPYRRWLLDTVGSWLAEMHTTDRVTVALNA